MNLASEFDLKSSLDRLFPNLSLGGELLSQGPFGVGFDIGLMHIDRAATIFHAVFQQSKELVLLSEDSSWEADPGRWCKVFALPGLLRSSDQLRVRSYNVPVSKEEEYVVQWAVIRPSALSAERLFEAIANQDHGLTPSVKGRVHMLDASSGVLLHMYDDRGMDIIATTSPPLQALRDSFASWIIREKLDRH
jgi:hypothetical protein